MADTRECPHCGVEIPLGSPEGLCRKCLMRAGLEILNQAGLHVRCPHCRNPIEIVGDDPLSDIECPSCRSHFHLISGHETISQPAVKARILGRFELIEQVGIGRFGAVWKARDTELDRIVAVKIPRRGQLDDVETQQFLREARAAAQVRHPNIVSVHEIGLDDGTVYIVSDFVDGASLSEWAPSRPMTPKEVAELCDWAHPPTCRPSKRVARGTLQTGELMFTPWASYSTSCSRANSPSAAKLECSLFRS